MPRRKPPTIDTTAAHDATAEDTLASAATVAKRQQVTLGWQDKILAATNGTQLGAIARCALGRNEPGQMPAFTGRASITSDGFVMCNFVDKEGRGHMGAFVGAVSDLRGNILGVATHLNLNETERAAWFKVMKEWIAVDYSGRGLALSDGKA